MRPRRIWRIGGSLVITIEYREVRRLKLKAGDLVAANFTPVEPSLRSTEAFQHALQKAIAATAPALDWLIGRND